MGQFAMLTSNNLVVDPRIIYLKSELESVGGKNELV